MAPYINEKEIYINYDTCYKYVTNDGKVLGTIEEQLSCAAHEEADTKMVFHLCQLQSDANVTICCSDTDVLVIILGNMERISKNSVVHMEIGTGNHQRFIDVSKLYEILGRDVSAALPAFHAVTGCDFNAAFFRKGKNRPFAIMRKSPDVITALIELSNECNSMQDIFPKIEELVCTTYGYKKIKSVNEARVATFSKAYKVHEKEFLDLWKKGIDGSALPPCRAELYQHFLRAAYIAQIWSHPHLQVQTNNSALNYGWIENQNIYEFFWFTGDQLPKTVDEITIPTEEGKKKFFYFLNIIIEKKIFLQRKMMKI